MYSESQGFLHNLKNVSNLDEVVCLEPTSFNEIPHILDILRARKCLIVNLSSMDESEAQRSVDFLVGGAFAIDGDQYRIGTSVFIFTPSTIELKFDYVANSKKGFS
ncbi:MAG: cell division protein SepF [Synechococcaceae cyanobacterium RL_1_2]|nr:cell division protein SepF [Synechococcaceae cyanobacterium RL_1_2]